MLDLISLIYCEASQRLDIDLRVVSAWEQEKLKTTLRETGCTLC